LKYWAYFSREGLIIPGLSVELASTLPEKQYQLQQGMGDVIFGEEHFELRKKFLEYAAIYNQLVYEHFKTDNR
jgi:hypothetical protein